MQCDGCLVDKVIDYDQAGWPTFWRQIISSGLLRIQISGLKNSMPPQKSRPSTVLASFYSSRRVCWRFEGLLTWIRPLAAILLVFITESVHQNLLNSTTSCQLPRIRSYPIHFIWYHFFCQIIAKNSFTTGPH